MKISIIPQSDLKNKSTHGSGGFLNLSLIQAESLLIKKGKKRKREREQKGEFAFGNPNKEACGLPIDRDLRQSQSSIGRS
jgi:hypothetical protein